jgi:hypothetical protein
MCHNTVLYAILNFVTVIMISYLWIANSSASAATVFSPPDKLDIGWNRLPGATQL